MKTLYFRCKLLTDIVLNVKAATEGNQESLDFIPGSNFLGIAAGVLYDKLKPEENLEIFHGGKVRFSDAHPEQLKIENGELKMTGKRSLRIPASFFYPKLEGMNGDLFVHHEFNVEEADFQLKQCRTGFYLFENEQIEEVKVEKTFAIKSAYDRKNRRATDEKMYGYESLRAGSSWLFDVNIDDDISTSLNDEIRKALEGTKRIGRSRTAQYGLVEIEEANDYEMGIDSKTDNKVFALIYADARLIFLDEYGIPTFRPTAENFGFKNGEIDWTKTQIRTFQYAPWNFKRQVRDTDRCGIEKGSVVYIKKQDGADELVYPKSPFVGIYQNEGFGKVIFNPDFLKAGDNSNGKAKYKVPKQEAEEKKQEEKQKLDYSADTGLLRYLKVQNNNEITEKNILEKVNDFVEKNKGKFTSESFASQWGTIRSIAQKQPDKELLIDKLFTEGKNGYIVHGVAKDKWDERGRKTAFENFVNNELRNYNGKDFQSALINLSSEMAKISKGSNNGK
jgi:hypothetical protein